MDMMLAQTMMVAAQPYKVPAMGWQAGSLGSAARTSNTVDFKPPVDVRRDSYVRAPLRSHHMTNRFSAPKILSGVDKSEKSKPAGFTSSSVVQLAMMSSVLLMATGCMNTSEVVMTALGVGLISSFVTLCFYAAAASVDRGESILKGVVEKLDITWSTIAYLMGGLVLNTAYAFGITHDALITSVNGTMFISKEQYVLATLGVVAYFLLPAIGASRKRSRSEPNKVDVLYESLKTDPVIKEDFFSEYLVHKDDRIRQLALQHLTSSKAAIVEAYNGAEDGEQDHYDRWQLWDGHVSSMVERLRSKKYTLDGQIQLINALDWIFAQTGEKWSATADLKICVRRLARLSDQSLPATHSLRRLASTLGVDLNKVSVTGGELAMAESDLPREAPSHETQGQKRPEPQAVL